MKIIFAFVFGAAVGALAALFLAPKSGEELRADLVREAQADREKLRSEYAQTMDGVSRKLDKMHGDVQTALSQAKGYAEAPAAEEETAESA